VIGGDESLIEQLKSRVEYLEEVVEAVYWALGSADGDDIRDAVEELVNDTRAMAPFRPEGCDEY
jgi:hypothetical protein